MMGSGPLTSGTIRAVFYSSMNAAPATTAYSSHAYFDAVLSARPRSYAANLDPAFVARHMSRQRGELIKHGRRLARWR